MKTALAAGCPVVFGFDVYSSFDWIGFDGVMKMPQPGETVNGSHAVCAVGYQGDHLIVRNSWGQLWGDHGHFYMPWSFVLNNQNASDFWLIKSVSNSTVIDQETIETKCAACLNKMPCSLL
uniref:Peptidase C1A papain C-terminal domain-containing protein n=1 Tax=viral metagenome TaxID=1070528 RepID=A0A6C0BKZ8_9ZZZZ